MNRSGANLTTTTDFFWIEKVFDTFCETDQNMHATNYRRNILFDILLHRKTAFLIFYNTVIFLFHNELICSDLLNIQCFLDEPSGNKLNFYYFAEAKLFFLSDISRYISISLYSEWTHVVVRKPSHVKKNR